MPDHCKQWLVGQGYCPGCGDEYGVDDKLSCEVCQECEECCQCDNPQLLDLDDFMDVMTEWVVD